MDAQTRVFAAVAEPHRRRMLDLLCSSPMPVGKLVELVGLSQPATSKHLRVLRESNLVRVRIDGPQRIYELRPEGLREMERWLMPYRKLWANRLDLLERELDKKKGARR